MGYHVYVYAAGTKANNKDTLDFLDDESLSVSFKTVAEKTILHDSLSRYGYQTISSGDGSVSVAAYQFQDGKHGIHVQLSRNCLSFSAAGSNMEGVFEISQTASELASIATT